jgi:hypothetical protein
VTVFLAATAAFLFLTPSGSRFTAAGRTVGFHNINGF